MTYDRSLLFVLRPEHSNGLSLCTGGLLLPVLNGVLREGGGGCCWLRILATHGEAVQAVTLGSSMDPENNVLPKASTH